MMKKILAVAFATMPLWAAAQQALWEGKKPVSPQINEDKTVTFRIYAPNAKEVKVTGDFLPTEKVTTLMGEIEVPGSAELSMHEGVWEFTTPEPLLPELYSYTFIVDGLKINDPSNVYLLRDISSLTNIFLIDGDRASNYAVNEVPHGTVSKVWYDSPKLGSNRRMTVYTPAGYEDSDRSYPVLYLLHGMGGDENAWPELGRATQILDNLIAQGKAQPMLVVMTNGNASQQATPGESSQGFVEPTMYLPKTMDGSFEQSFPEVVSFIDRHYRTIPEKSGRAIAGLSMGGFHSLHISKEYPDMFDYIGLFSAAILPDKAVKSPVYEDMEGKLRRQFENAPALYWIAIGNTDFLYKANQDYRKMLDENGYRYTYYESPEGHIWKNWRVYLSEFLPQLFK